jgi:hypothetical protein
VKNKTAMSCGIMDLRPENAVILRSCPAHPFARKRPSEWMGHSLGKIDEK